MNTEELAELRDRLSGMSQRQLVEYYEAGLKMCRLDRGQAPRANFVQGVVTAWRELRRREKVRK